MYHVDVIVSATRHHVLRVFQLAAITACGLLLRVKRLRSDEISHDLFTGATQLEGFLSAFATDFTFFLFPTYYSLLTYRLAA